MFLLRHPEGIFPAYEEDHGGFPPECPFKNSICENPPPLPILVFRSL